MSGFKVGIAHDVDGLIAMIDAREKDIEVWHVSALNQTARDVRDAEVQKMAEVFDRPTRFTENALMVVPATPDNLRAEVRFKEGFGSIPAWRYLGAQVEGGRRVKKTHERALER